MKITANDSWIDPVYFDLPVGAGKFKAALADTSSPCSPLQKMIIKKVTASRAEIRRGDTTRYEGHLNSGLTGEIMAILHRQVLLLVKGYDKDSREIYEIPEVRAYWSLVQKNQPTLLFYAARSHPHILRAVFACLAPRLEILRSRHHDRIRVCIEGRDIKSLLAAEMSMCVAMSVLMGIKAHDALALLAVTIETLLHSPERS